MADDLPVPGALLLGLDGRRDSFVSIRGTADDPTAGGVPGGVKGDLLVYAGSGTPTLYQYSGSAWGSVSAPAAAYDAVYRATAHGIVEGTSGALGAANRAALNALITTVHTAGGGTIYFPRGTYRFAVDGSNETILVSAVRNIRFLGDGAGSKLLWDGAFAASGHFFRIDRGCQFITFENLYIAEGTGTKNDVTELQHLLAFTANVNSATITENIDNCRVLNCRFGSTTGDAVNIIGGIADTACKAAIAGTVAAGAVAGPFTQPVSAQRVAVSYPAAWDGGSFTIAGTNAQGDTVSELVPAAVNKRILTDQEFLTITGITKGATGLTSNTASIGYAYMTQNVHVVGCVMNGFDYANHGGNVDNENGYRSAVGCQRCSRYVYIQRNYMTGCGDQLIDFEPTGSGDLGPWFIEDNIIVNANPLGGTPVTAISFWGNEETYGRNRRSRIHHNTILSGGIGGGKFTRVDITDNYIVMAVSGGGIGIDCSGTALDTLVKGNRVIGNSTSTQVPIYFAPNNSLGADGLRIIDNTIETYRTGISVEAGKNVTIRGNHVVYKAATTNTHNAVVLAAHDPSTRPMQRFIVDANIIEGDAGGGSFQYAIELQPGSQANGSISVTNNRGSGIATRGVNVPAGTYSPICVISNNGFATPTNQVNLGAGVIVAIGGNLGGITWYMSPTADPNNVGALDGAPLGSIYSGQGSGAVYRKNAAGATGWSAM